MIKLSDTLALFIRKFSLYKNYLSINLVLLGLTILVFIILGISLILSLIILIPIFIIVSLFELYLQQKKSIKRQKDLLLLFLYSFYINLSNKKSLNKSIDNALKISGNKTKKNWTFYIFAKIKKELKFHDISNAIEAINNAIANDKNQIYTLTNFDLSEILESISNEYKSNLDIIMAIKHAYRQLYDKKIENENKNLSFIKKFFTLSIVFTTVIPCILLFGFIAYSMIFYSYFEFEMFSFLLVGILPSIYMIIQMYISDAYE